MIAVAVPVAPALAAEDFAALFADDFEGISLSLTDPSQLLAPRPRAIDLDVGSLTGFSLSAEDLTRVRTITDPVGAAELAARAEAVRPSFSERFVRWVTRSSNESDSASVFSALARDVDEPGARVDIDPAAEEVMLEYRVGF